MNRSKYALQKMCFPWGLIFDVVKMMKWRRLCCCTYVWAVWLWAWCGPTKPAGEKKKTQEGLRERIFHLILRSFAPPLSHYYLLMVLKLQAKVVPLDEVHVGAHQVQQHLARGFLLWTEEKQWQRNLAGTTAISGFLTAHGIRFCPGNTTWLTFTFY